MVPVPFCKFNTSSPTLEVPGVDVMLVLNDVDEKPVPKASCSLFNGTELMVSCPNPALNS